MIFRILEDQFAQKIQQSKDADRRFMQLALALGRRGQGRTWPNPAVGAVIVKDGVIVGRGWTQAGGRPHAEPEALRRAGEAARGATLYVTLEPCSHFGRSPPCADAVVAAGLARVVSAIEDPNPEVGGKGHAKLRAAGIAVDVGLCQAEAAHDHAGHFHRIRDQRPHVILKLAVSADDKIAAGGHKPVAITGEAARTRVHLLRAQCDESRIFRGKGKRLIERIRMKRLTSSEHRRERLDRHAHHIVLRLARGQRRTGRLCVKPEHP